MASKRRKFFLWIGIVVVLLVISLIAIVRLTPDPRQVHLQAWKKRGYATNLAELYAANAAIPATENAALPYQAGFAMMVSVPRNLGTNTFIEQIDDVTLASMRQLLSDNENALIEFDKASLRARFGYPWAPSANSVNILLPYLSQMKDLARLRTVAMHLAIHEKNPDAAIAELEKMVQSYRHLKQDPFLISRLVAYAILGIAESNLGTLLSELELNRNQLERLQRIFDDPQVYKDAVSGLTGEIVMFSEFPEFNNPMAMAGGPNGNSPGMAQLFSGLLYQGIRVTGYFQRDVAWGMGRIIDFTERFEKKPFALSATNWPGEFPKTFILSRMLLPSLARYHEKTALAALRFENAQIALAAMMYRLDQGEYPKSLESMVPKYLTAIPIDPFSGAPYFYEREGEGFIFWSVGTNLVDDKGITKPGLRDVAFRVNVPERVLKRPPRRQPEVVVEK